jgi:ABC-2 type transport system ATP-binding protein
MSLIEVERLQKRFHVRQAHAGRFGALRGLVSGGGREVVAVDDVSFRVEAGEMIGYVGPNGAGKSTTIKMLTGILVPSGGRASVAGLVPWEARQRLAERIGVVFGQRTQLWWDLPLIDSLDLLGRIYRVPPARFRENMHRFGELLDLGPFLDQPVRQLSLGQRMRGDLAAALLHEPPILYLDEPTIGLDVVAKERVRLFLRELNRETGVTVLLTTHDMTDIARLCERMIIIDHGKLLYDGGVAAIAERYGGQRRLIVDLDEDVAEPEVPGATLERREGGRLWLSFRREEISAPDLIARVTTRYRIRDLMLEEPDIEEVVRRIYEEGLAD